MPKTKAAKLAVTKPGTIEEVTIRESENTARVEIRHGPKPKKDKDGMTLGPFPESTTLRIPKERARDLRVGQKVEVGLKDSLGGSNTARV